MCFSAPLLWRRYSCSFMFVVWLALAVRRVHRATDVGIAHRAAGRLSPVLPSGVFVYLLIQPLRETAWAKARELIHQPTTAEIGDLFFDSCLLPFGLASLV